MEQDEIDEGDKTEQPAQNPVSGFIDKNSSVEKTDDKDTLIDVHIGNPLRRITELLEEIKKQKAFSFTLKGSLGLMGVVLTLSLIGFFGTTHALCDKGVQTHIGQVKMLTVTDTDPDTVFTKIIAVADYVSRVFKGQTTTSPKYRYILITANNTIHLERGRDVSLADYKDQTVFATGLYDSCSANLKLSVPQSVEAYK